MKPKFRYEDIGSLAQWLERPVNLLIEVVGGSIPSRAVDYFLLSFCNFVKTIIVFSVSMYVL